MRENGGVGGEGGEKERMDVSRKRGHRGRDDLKRIEVSGERGDKRYNIDVL